MVHEAYVRLSDQKTASMQHHAHLSPLAAKVMRNVWLTAPKRLATKRGGEQLRISLTTISRYGQKPEVDLVALDDTMKQLARPIPNTAGSSNSAFFGGLTIQQKRRMRLSHATTERYWSFAQAWLRRELAASDHEDPEGIQHGGTLSRSRRPQTGGALISWRGLEYSHPELAGAVSLLPLPPTKGPTVLSIRLLISVSQK